MNSKSLRYYWEQLSRQGNETGEWLCSRSNDFGFCAMNATSFMKHMLRDIWKITKPTNLFEKRWIHNHYFAIEYTDRSNAGTYTCVATNDAGATSYAATLDVNGTRTMKISEIFFVLYFSQYSLSSYLFGFSLVYIIIFFCFK